MPNAEQASTFPRVFLQGFRGKCKNVITKDSQQYRAQMMAFDFVLAVTILFLFVLNCGILNLYLLYKRSSYCFF